MSGRNNKPLIALSLCGAFLFAAPVVAQQPDPPAPTPAADDSASPPADGQPKNLGQGTKAEAEHSAEATAHKSLRDPNNQLGTSLQGRTRPIAGADSQTAASNAAPAAGGQ